jgi:hypothetical protein
MLHSASILASMLAALSPAQQYDSAGNDPATLGGPVVGSPGSALTALTGPVSPGSDLCHDGQYLMEVSAYDGFAGVYFLNDATGAVASTLAIGTFNDFGVAWDDERELIVLCDSTADTISTYTRAGVPVSTWSYPFTGNVGLAWDCRRDVYWVADWTTESLHALNPATGAVLSSISASAVGASRIAGLAYDANEDVLYVGGRDQNAIFGIEAATGSLRCSFASTNGGNNPQGLAFSPRGAVWHSSWNSTGLYELEGCNSTHPQLRLSPNFPTAGGPITLTMSGLGAGHRAVFGYSLTGCGPTNSPLGEMLVSPPVQVLAIVAANGAGVATVAAGVPIGLAGRTVWMHGGNLTTGQRCNNVVLNP